MQLVSTGLELKSVGSALGKQLSLLKHMLRETKHALFHIFMLALVKWIESTWRVDRGLFLASSKSC